MPSTGGAQQAKPQVGLVVSAVLLAYLAQMTLNPVIAPLAREVGLAEWQIGLVISTAAIMVVLTSQFWGRHSQSWGLKPVLTIALAIGAVAMLLFVFLSFLGVTGYLQGTALFLSLLVARGILFGMAIAAIMPTAQAFIAVVTTTEESRVKGMASLGAAQGLAAVGGAVIGGLLSAVSLLVSISVVPVLLVVALVTTVVFLKPEPKTEWVSEPVRISPLDGRVWPFLLAGFGMFTALGFIQILTGFFAQDRFALEPGPAGLLTGGALLAAGLGMIVAQAVVVPLTRWFPPTLLRVGTGIATVGFLVFIIEANIAWFVLSVALIGFGIGLATPGYTAGPSLLMSPDEQGGLAGLIGATNGLTFVIAPTLSTVLYGYSSVLPIGIGAAIMALVFIFVCVHPRFRRGAMRA